MNRRCAEGFLIITCIVYCAILAVVVATCIQLSLLIVPQFYTLTHWCAYTNFYTAHDVLYRDLCCSPHNPQWWYKTDTSGLIWHTDTSDHGWLIIKDNLWYKEGTYNVETETWSSGQMSLIARDVQFNTVDVIIKKGTMHSISCHAYKKGEHMHQWHCTKVFYGTC